MKWKMWSKIRFSFVLDIWLHFLFLKFDSRFSNYISLTSYLLLYIKGLLTTALQYLDQPNSNLYIGYVYRMNEFHKKISPTSVWINHMQMALFILSWQRCQFSRCFVAVSILCPLLLEHLHFCLLASYRAPAGLFVSLWTSLENVLTTPDKKAL